MADDKQEPVTTTGITGNPIVDLQPTLMLPFPFPPIIVPHFMT